MKSITPPVLAMFGVTLQEDGNMLKCKDCNTTDESKFKDLVTDDWCDECFDKSYDEYIEQDKQS